MSVLFKVLIVVFMLNAAWLCCAMWKAHRRTRWQERAEKE